MTETSLKPKRSWGYRGRAPDRGGVQPRAPMDTLGHSRSREGTSSPSPSGSGGRRELPTPKLRATSPVRRSGRSHDNFAHRG